MRKRPSPRTSFVACPVLLSERIRSCDEEASEVADFMIPGGRMRCPVWGRSGTQRSRVNRRLGSATGPSPEPVSEGSRGHLDCFPTTNLVVVQAPFAPRKRILSFDLIVDHARPDTLSVAAEHVLLDKISRCPGSVAAFARTRGSPGIVRNVAAFARTRVCPRMSGM